jgi:hypothetical protein
MTIEMNDLQKGAMVVIEKEFKIGGKLLKTGERYSVFMGAGIRCSRLIGGYFVRKEYILMKQPHEVKVVRYIAIVVLTLALGSMVWANW